VHGFPGVPVHEVANFAAQVDSVGQRVLDAGAVVETQSRLVDQLASDIRPADAGHHEGHRPAAGDEVVEKIEVVIVDVGVVVDLGAARSDVVEDGLGTEVVGEVVPPSEAVGRPCLEVLVAVKGDASDKRRDGHGFRLICRMRTGDSSHKQGNCNT